MLQPTYSMDGAPPYSYRRPGFLSRLGGEEYVTVFKNLRSHKDLSCPTW